MKRVTDKELAAIVARINRMSGQPETAYGERKENGDMTWNVGHYSLSGAYGGVSLVQVANVDGGERDVLNVGHVPKREMQTLLYAFISGLVAASELRDVASAALDMLRDPESDEFTANRVEAQLARALNR